jgi:carboxymethylenebutenolidase
MQQVRTIAGEGVSVEAYCAAPDSGGPFPGLVLIEEVWGVDAHIKDLCNRFAKEGFVVLSPELIDPAALAQVGPEIVKDMWGEDAGKKHAAQARMREAMAPIWTPEFAASALKKLKACLDDLLADKRVNGNVGVTGFCFGGSYAFQLGISDARIKAVVPFYGRAPEPLEEVAKIQAPILAFYGEQDANLVSKLPELVDAMKRSDRDFSYMVYPQAGHAFLNDTNPRAYNEDAARDAWEKSLAFLHKHLDA